MTTLTSTATALGLGVATALMAAEPMQPKAAAPAAPPLSDTEQSIKDLKNPAPWMTWGADLRIRNEYFNNILTLTPHDARNLNEQDYFRFRGRLWLSLLPVEGVSLNARLATEPREWMKPAGYTPMKGQSGLDMTEGVIDNLNVQWKNILGHPATLTVGRQDILWGDGWLMGDGTPYDGSWTYFLDAARFSYDFKPQHTTVEVMGILQSAKDDEWLPTINNQNRYLSEQDEKGAVLTVANSSIKEANLTGYFVYKHDDKASDFSTSNRAPAGGDNADIYTLGARVTGVVDEHWKYWVEGAYQFGEKQDLAVKYPSTSSEYRDISAFGVNTKATYMFKDQFNNQVTLAYEFLSGDDPKTQGDEMFDVLWGRWPYWSEIGLYSFAAETRIGQQANLHRIGPSWTVTPVKKLDFTAAYAALFSPQEVPTREASAALFTHDGNFRGHYVSGVLKYKFGQHVNGHLWSEFLFPGDYYQSKAMWSFLRAEVMFTF